MSKRRNKKPAGAADSFKVVNIIVDASATLPAKQEMLDTAREDLAGSNSQPTKAEMSAPEQKPLPVAEVKPALPSSTAEKKSVKPKEKDDPSAAAPYDFRGLPEPEKTFERVKAVLCDKRLPHGVRSAAAVICLEFFGSSDKQIVNLSQTLTDERGFSLALRTSVLKTLKTAGLIEYEKIARQGTQITLLF